MSTYYNEIDPFAAAWLRSLIAAGHIAPGDVDERSITDVSPDDLVGYQQCHFFAGIGGWSLALRLAGVPDDAPVWTGSCPCQGLSIAGKRGMRADDWQRLRAEHPDPVTDARHLWPAFARIIREHRPAVVFGEQAASADGRTWLTAVRADLEDLGYGVGAADLCAAGVGAPHIRQRLWWGAVRVADAGRFGVRGAGSGTARGTSRGVQGADGERERLRADAGAGGAVVGGVADAHGERGGQGCTHVGRRSEGGDAQPRSGSANDRSDGGLANPNDPRPVGRDGADQRPAWPDGVGGEGSGAPHVDWRDADWLRCRDGRWRPVESGTCPLADGVPPRVGRLRGYGNAIAPSVAAAFVTALLEVAP